MIWGTCLHTGDEDQLNELDQSKAKTCLGKLTKLTTGNAFSIAKSFMYRNLHAYTYVNEFVVFELRVDLQEAAWRISTYVHRGKGTPSQRAVLFLGRPSVTKCFTGHSELQNIQTSRQLNHSNFHNFY